MRFNSTTLVLLLLIPTAGFVMLVMENYVDIDISKEGEGLLVSPGLWTALAKEIFVALIVALVVIIAVERASWQEQTKLVSRSTEEIRDTIKGMKGEVVGSAQDQFRGLEKDLRYASLQANKDIFIAALSIGTPKEYVDQFVSDVLECQFSRSILYSDIQLKPFPGRNDKVLFACEQKSIIRNTSRKMAEFFPRLMIPLPNDQVLAEKAKVNSVKVSGLLDEHRVGDAIAPYPIVGEQVDKYFKGIHHRRGDSEFEFEKVDVEPGDSIEVVVSYSLVKDWSDNEIFTSLLPTMRLDVQVMSELANVEVKALSLNRGKLAPHSGNEENKKLLKWHTEHPVLPFQGFIVFWRPE